MTDRRIPASYELTPIELRTLDAIIEDAPDGGELLRAAHRLEALADAHEAVPFVAVQAPFGSLFEFRFDRNFMVASIHLRVIADAVAKRLVAASP